MNLPNKLTTIRIVLSVLIVFILLFPFSTVNISFPEYIIEGVKIDSKLVFAGVIFLIASLTDFLDGYLARKHGLVTNTGKMLDAIADKVLVNSVLIILAYLHRISPIIPVVIVLRDILVNAIKMEAASRGKVVAAIGSAKLKTATLMIGIFMVFISNMPFEIWNINIAEMFLYFATIMSAVSMVQYYLVNKKLLMSE